MSRALPSLLLLLPILAAGCGAESRRVALPPRVDLADWSLVGVIQFEGDADPTLSRAATDRFVRMLRTTQPRARLRFLGTRAEVLAELGRESLDLPALRALAEHYRVEALLTGTLNLSGAVPVTEQRWEVSPLPPTGDAVALTIELVELEGGSLSWRRSARQPAPRRARETERELLPRLVAELRGDFAPTWGRP